MFTVGLVSLVTALSQLVVFETNERFTALIPLVPLFIGSFILKRVITTRKRRNKLYVHGIPSTATIDRARKTNMHINRRSVFEFGWTFYVNDRPFRGKRHTMNPKALDFNKGDLVWVLYDPSDPDESVEWPPVS